ncbi:MAG: DUF1015 family protein [Acidimicrobiales bacterium]
MPAFEPFPGLRYDLDQVDLGDVIAPPYDVIDAEDQTTLEERSPFNAVRVELSRDEADRDRYEAARCRLDEWIESGVLVRDDPSFYVMQMRFVDESGTARQTTGVLGAMQLVPPTEGSILPHERTTPKAKGDRLFLLRACKANLSPIWGLSLSNGLSKLVHLDREPDASATDEAGIEHLLWRISDAQTIDAIRESVSSTPIVIADGHHHYETALAFPEEMGDGGPGGWDHLLTYVVELVEDELSVRAIHRLIAGLPSGFDLRAALAPSFDIADAGTVDASILDRMEAASSMCLITTDGASLLRPKAALDQAEHDLDSSRLDLALGALPGHELTYQHGWDLAARAVERGEADAAVLIRPATIGQISEVGHGGSRMPPKTTFFHPKPRTGMVFRTLD